MPKPLSPPSERPFLSFSEFLAALFSALDREGVRFCVLRNYEGFPAENLGNDVDFLIRPFELPRAMHALRSCAGVRIVGFTEAHSVASVFLEGTSAIPDGRSLQVDFFLNLSWKGLPYLLVDAVLSAAIPRRAGNLDFLVPSPVHEAITSLFASLLVGGWLKEKYFPQVQRTFASDRSEVIAALLPQFGLKPVTRLVDSMIDGDRQMTLGCITPLRAALTRRKLLQNPVRGAFIIICHYVRVFAFRYSPKRVETVCILGLDASSKTMLIESLSPLLQASAKVVEPHAAGSRGPAACGCFASMAKALVWLLEEWLGQFLKKKNLTLRIGEGRSYDLAIAPQEHSYSGPKWFAQLAGKLFPSPDLWLLLDTDVDGRKSTNGKALPAEAFRRLEAYRAFVKMKKKYVILNASQPAARVTEEAYAAIIEMLAQRADRQLKRRFCALDVTAREEEHAGCRE